MWDEIYIWMEEQSGLTYDLRDDIKNVSGDKIFLSPRSWKSDVIYVINKFDEALDVVDENWKNLYDGLPDRYQLKKMITAQALGGLVDVINSIKQKLNIDEVDITTVDQLQVTIETLCDIVTELKANPIEEILRSEWFDDYDEENDHVLTEEMGLSKNDLPNMSYTIQSIVDLYDDEEE